MLRKIVLAVTTLTIGLALLAPPVAAAPTCSITWGSLEKAVERLEPSPLTDVRAGEHPCYDRLVFALDGPAPGYRVRYVPQVAADGSGEVLPLRGGAFLEVIVHAPAYDDVGDPTVPYDVGDRIAPVAGFRTFRDVKYAGSFEGMTTVGLGVRARLPFRVFTLTGPESGSRVVVDVAHQW